MTIEVTPSYIRYYLFYGWDGWGTWLASFHKSKGNKYKLSFEVHIHFPWVFIEQTLIRSSYQPWEKRVPSASISRWWSRCWIFRWFSSACPRWTTYQNGSNLELACDRKCCFALFKMLCIIFMVSFCFVLQCSFSGTPGNWWTICNEGNGKVCNAKS
jgi:hypothetical protein